MTEISSTLGAQAATATSHNRLRELSQDMETAFLSEMLKHAGMAEARDGMGGGIGEDQFSSFLLQEQAKTIVASGGIGLAEQIFDSLVGKMK